MKKNDLWFSALLLPIDYLMIILAGIFTYFLRFQAIATLRPIIFELPFWFYFKILLIVATVSLVIFALNGLYHIGRQRFNQEVVKIFSGVTMVVMLIVLFIFFRRELFSSRFIVLVGWLMAIMFICFGRLIVHLIRLHYFKLRRGLEPVIVLGQGDLANDLVSNIIKDRGLGYNVLDQLSTVGDLIIKWKNRANEIKIIFQGDQTLSKEEMHQLVEFCNEHQIILKYTIDSYGALWSNIRTETIAGIPLIEIKRTALDGWGRILKRGFDLIISILLLIVLSPTFLLIAIFIKIDSLGPIFVRLNRVGYRKQEFGLYKFRSMVERADQMKVELLKHNERKGPLFKMQNDPRVTFLGKFLRKWSFDELPQLFNVVRGEMSLVGPRPHEPQEVNQYKKEDKQLLTIKPGITGLAQISGRSTISFDEEARLDIYYIENWSLGFDLQILIKTIPVVLGHKNVA